MSYFRRFPFLSLEPPSGPNGLHLGVQVCSVLVADFSELVEYSLAGSLGNSIQFFRLVPREADKPADVQKVPFIGVRARGGPKDGARICVPHGHPEISVR